MLPLHWEEDCFDFCHQLLNQWGVGKKDKNNGLVYSSSNRPTLHSILYRIRSGRSSPRRYLQEDSDEIHDSVSERRELECRNSSGFWKRLAKFLTVLWRTILFPVQPITEGVHSISSSPYFSLYWLVEVSLSFPHAKQSPLVQYGKHTLQRSGSRLISKVNGVRTEDITLHVYRNCGHTLTRRQQSYDNDYHHRGGGGPFIGGFWRRQKFSRRRQFWRRQLRWRNGRRRWCRFTILVNSRLQLKPRKSRNNSKI